MRIEAIIKYNQPLLKLVDNGTVLKEYDFTVLAQGNPQWYLTVLEKKLIEHFEEIARELNV